MISWADNSREIINEIRGAIGRDIELLIPTVSGCSACGLDPITNTSVDSFCTVCSGVYWIETLSGCTLEAHVTWGSTDELDWRPGGRLYTGTCRAQVEYTDANDLAVHDAKYFVVDGYKLWRKKVIYRGVQDINRILIELEEQENKHE